MPRPRRTFTREFKVQAVKRVTEQGYSYAEAARQLGVREHQIRTWKKLPDAELSGAACGTEPPPPWTPNCAASASRTSNCVSSTTS